MIKEHQKKCPDFFEYTNEINESYPDEFQKIPLLKQLFAHNNLSLVFL